VTKVSELEGALLDYWVARAEGVPPSEVEIDRGAICRVYLPDEARRDHLGSVWDFIPGEWVYYQPSVWWHNAGPIIERERVTVMSPKGGRFDWLAEIIQGEHFAFQNGPTPLIAAMRAYVASKFGEEVPDAATP
jgi:hypothetical protein